METRESQEDHTPSSLGDARELISNMWEGKMNTAACSLTTTYMQWHIYAFIHMNYYVLQQILFAENKINERSLL